MNPCLYCGTHMPNPRRKQCGAEECARLFKNERMRVFNERRSQDGRAREYREKRAEHRAAYDKTNRGRWYVERTCVSCGGAWTTHRKDAKYCSRPCYIKGRFGETRKPMAEPKPSRRRLKALKDLAKAAQGTTGSVWTAGNCHRCGASFICLLTHTPGRYCSRPCLKADAKARRRAAQRNAYVEHVYRSRVFARDQWICGLCNKKVDHQAVSPSPLSPVIDHVIPLALGGTHEMANVQCAHFICNSRKGARILTRAEQLMLAG